MDVETYIHPHDFRLHPKEKLHLNSFYGIGTEFDDSANWIARSKNFKVQDDSSTLIFSMIT